jgi:glycosyltransferase involved in cell wall biosynthesis
LPLSADTSLIVTVLNEAHTIRNWLITLGSLTTHPDELVVCDGGSTDGTAEILREWAETAPFPVHVIVAQGANISEGRNIAIAAAQGPWIAITDAGTTLDVDWLGELIAARADAEVVSGFFYPTGSSLFERVLATMITFTREEIDPHSFLPSSRSLMIRKEAWVNVGGYPEWLDYCEDLVFDINLRAAGHSFTFAPEALVSWSARPTVRSYYKQYYRYARGDGKSGLWPRRHAIRYAIYGAGLAAVALMPLGVFGSLLAVGAGVLIYHFRYFRRLLKSTRLTLSEKAIGAALVPFLGTVGDVAKMVGYPVGLSWRRQHYPEISKKPRPVGALAHV